MAALPTSNLGLTIIAATLGCAADLRVCCASTAVKAQGLNATYCPGYDAASRLANLRADKKQSYFKGYDHDVTLIPIEILSIEYYVPDGNHWRVTFRINSLKSYLFNVIGVCWVNDFYGYPTIADNVFNFPDLPAGYGIGTYVADVPFTGDNSAWRAFARTSNSSNVLYSAESQEAP